MGLESILDKVKDVIIKPTKEEEEYWKQLSYSTFGEAIKATESLIKNTLSNYSEKDKETFNKVVKFYADTGYGNILLAYITAQSANEASVDYRTQREIREIVVKRMLGKTASYINPKTAEFIVRGGNTLESAVELLTSGLYHYLKNNGVEDPTPMVNAYQTGLALLSNAITRLYNGLREIYTPKGIGLKLPKLTEVLKDLTMGYMHYIGDIAIRLGSKEKESEAKKEGKKKLIAEEPKLEEELPPAPYIP